MGHEPGAKRGRRLRSRRDDDRPYRAARALRQSVLWRAQAEPLVHRRQPVALFSLCEYRGRAGRLTPAALPLRALASAIIFPFSRPTNNASLTPIPALLRARDRRLRPAGP